MKPLPSSGILRWHAKSIPCDADIGNSMVKEDTELPRGTEPGMVKLAAQGPPGA
jgi:hypothetical protein